LSVPLLVEYGATAWKLAACVVALLGLVATRVVRNAGERRRARAEVARYLAAVTAPVLAQAEGPTSLSGPLYGGSATTLWIGQRALSDRQGELWVDYKGDRVELAGPVRVVRGTVGKVSRSVPKDAPSAIRAAVALDLDRATRVSRVLKRAAGGDSHRLSQVRDGDLVIVHGVLGRRGSVDRLGVRSWLLDPETPGGEITIIAMSPRVVAMALRWYVALILAGVLAAGACAGMYELGNRSLASARSASTPSAQLKTWDPLALAAASPGTRSEALEEIARRYPDLRAAIDRLR
jgi:hypothetical protein